MSMYCSLHKLWITEFFRVICNDRLCFTSEDLLQQDQLENSNVADQFETFLADVLQDYEDDNSADDLVVPLTPAFRSLKHLFGYTVPLV